MATLIAKFKIQKKKKQDFSVILGWLSGFFILFYFQKKKKKTLRHWQPHS